MMIADRQGRLTVEEREKLHFLIGIPCDEQIFIIKNNGDDKECDVSIGDTSSKNLMYDNILSSFDDLKINSLKAMLKSYSKFDFITNRKIYLDMRENINKYFNIPIDGAIKKVNGLNKDAYDNTIYTKNFPENNVTGISGW